MVFVLAGTALFFAVRAVPGDPIALRLKNPDPVRVLEERERLANREMERIQERMQLAEQENDRVRERMRLLEGEREQLQERQRLMEQERLMLQERERLMEEMPASDD